VRSAVLAAASALALALGAVAASDAGPSNGLGSQGAVAFRGEISRIDARLATRMTGLSWRPGCPVRLRDLRLLTLSYRRFDGKARIGRLIVHADVAGEVVDVFRTLYGARFPIRRMVAVDAYRASDFRSIEADNTSAFNCRVVDGTTRWSEHAYGRAIDLNPIENPYVYADGTTSHRASRRYLRRSPYRPGMAVEGSAVVRAFDAVGWGWGGRWPGVKDYQHFSASGR
jgi:D-alanyl-D-alanine carboxypeptidase